MAPRPTIMVDDGIDHYFLQKGIDKRVYTVYTVYKQLTENKEKSYADFYKQ